MVRISEKRVKKEIFVRILDQLFDYVVGVKTKSESKRFLNEFFTPSEKIMLAKRLALIVMLKRGYSFTAIRKTLKMSESTIAKFWRLLRQSKFSFIQEKELAKKKKKEFWETLEKILNAGLPPRGRGRWSRVYRMLGPDIAERNRSRS